LDDSLGLGEDQKQRLLNNTERLEITGKRLEDAYRLTVETEQISTGVMQNLAEQRETIQRSRARLRETNAELNRSSRLMNNMIMRVMRDKFILYGIAGVFAVVVTLGIYFKVAS
jgi:vesicle transport through interaction with t-SNAREs protein 1